jgi:hypothetical protein
MGQAKKRGTFQERKEQAVAAGRVKGHKPNKKETERAILRKMMDEGPLGILPFLFTSPYDDNNPMRRWRLI